MRSVAAIVAALVCACGSKNGENRAQPPPIVTTATDAASPPPLAPAARGPQLGTVLAPIPDVVAIAIYRDSLYALSGAKAAVTQIKLADGGATELAHDDEYIGAPGGLAVGLDGIYWNEVKGVDGKIVRLDLSRKTAATTLLQRRDAVGAIMMDATHLYVAGTDGLASVRKQTLDVTGIHVNGRGVRSFAIDADSIYYVSRAKAWDPDPLRRDTQRYTQIERYKKTGRFPGLELGEPLLVVDGPEVGADPSSLIIDDGENLYWSRGDAIVSVPKNRGDAITKTGLRDDHGKLRVVVAGHGISDLVIVGAQLYWIENGEAIATASTADGTPKQLGFSDQARGLVSDGKLLYWSSATGIRSLPVREGDGAEPTSVREHQTP